LGRGLFLPTEYFLSGASTNVSITRHAPRKVLVLF
jgi:hypothetical protein